MGFFAIVWQSFEIKVISFELGLEVTDLDTLMRADTLDKNKMSDLETYCTCNNNNVINARILNKIYWGNCDNRQNLEKSPQAIGQYHKLYRNFCVCTTPLISPELTFYLTLEALFSRRSNLSMKKIRQCLLWWFG